MNCPKCGDTLPGQGTHCPRCGLLGALEEEVRGLVSRANLLRIRGDWDGAGELCRQALALDGVDESALSLLGDIHREQDRLEEALRWYRKAAEAHPHSAAALDRLHRAERALAARREATEWDPVAQQSGAALSRTYRTREWLQRVIAVTGAITCGAVLVAAILVSGRERPAAGNADSLPLFPRRPRPARTLQFDTPQEKLLLTGLTANGAPGAAQVARLTLDPRTQNAQLRAILPESATRNMTAPHRRELILREAYRLAHRLHSVAPNMRSMQVHVLGIVDQPGNAGQLDTYLLADISAADLGIDPDRITRGELEAFFKQQMWGAGM